VKATFPLAGANIDRSDGFGATEGRQRPHGGVDLTVPGGSAGKPILAMAAGKVVESGPNGGWGNTIVIDHGNGFFTRYAHMVNPSPHGVGAEVTAGQEIGNVGSTGESTGPHLHVEVMKGGTATGNRVDPIPYLDGAQTLG
jgi:murein DD-endopeptidase MepM/ murein hydrolase activator NlpD